MAKAKRIGWKRLKHFWPLYVLVLPSLLLVGTFAYSPAISAVYHSFFRWDGGQTNEFVGFANYQRALTDEVFLGSFWMLFLLIFSALFKMVLPIITAVSIHRLVNDKWQYRYRVLFVIPMIIPIWVRVLLWKFFYNPQLGPLNKMLSGTGLDHVLRGLDSFMPMLAERLSVVHDYFVGPLFGNLWGMAVFGFLLLVATTGIASLRKRTFFWVALLAVGAAVWVPFTMSLESLLVVAFTITGMIGCYLGLAALIGTRHDSDDPRAPAPDFGFELKLVISLLGFLMLVSFFAFRQPFNFMFVGPAAFLTGISLNLWLGPVLGPVGTKWSAIGVLGCAVLIMLATRVWDEPTKAFDMSQTTNVLQETRTVQPPPTGTWTMPAERRAKGWTVNQSASDAEAGLYVIEAPETTEGQDAPERETWQIMQRYPDGSLKVGRYQTVTTPKPFAPAWLGNSKLTRPAIIFYGFPWVGVFGVLIYLAGLQNIPQDVYEAADLDGIGWFSKFTRIEFPLIMTQIRLNLVLMVIATIKQYALVLVLVGPGGGTGQVAQVPGLYMFHTAFRYGEAGYASAIGMLLFILILALTLINQRYVRVEK